MDGQCHKNCLKAHLSRLKIPLNLVEIFWTTNMKIATKDIFLKLIFSVLKIARTHNNLSFLSERSNKYHEHSHKGYFAEVDLQYPEYCTKLIIIYPFYLKD